METRKSLKKVFFILILAILLLPIFVFAYSNKSTHPALTNETIDVFNNKYSELEITKEEKDFILNGSIEEDDPSYRCLNHFFDPVYNNGLSGISMSAKNWSQNTKYQAGFSNLSGIGFSRELFDSNTDYSWSRAVFEYVHGDKERALETLGHILHLIQDMTVPPHVRNDQHMIDPSPYEVFTKDFDKDNLNGLSDELEDKDIVIKNSLDDYFVSLATFTNNNFFSKDTINSGRYVKPVIGNDEKKGKTF